MKTAYIRCFIAIEIPSCVQRVFEKIQNELRTEIGKAVWIRFGNFHLTLKFLGDVKNNSISEIRNAIEKVAIKQKPFALDFGGIGTFPDFSRPRVLWIGLKQGGKITTSLSRDINNALIHADFKKDIRYHPHVTLARLRHQIDLRGYVDLFEEYQTLQHASMPVGEIELVKSELHPNGAVYTPMSRFHLGRE